MTTYLCFPDRETAEQALTAAGLFATHTHTTGGDFPERVIFDEDENPIGVEPAYSEPVVTHVTKQVLWPAYYAGDNGRIWRQIDAETCEDVPGIHVNVEADVPELLAQYVVQTPDTPFTVVA